MTGNVLRRLRKAYGFTQEEVARAGSYSGRHVVCDSEKKGVSWVVGRRQGGVNKNRQKSWRRYLHALRELKGGQRATREKNEASEVRPFANLPQGTTHTAHGEPLKAVVRNGRQLIFRHDGHDWVRSARNNLVGAQKV